MHCNNRTGYCGTLAIGSLTVVERSARTVTANGRQAPVQARVRDRSLRPLFTDLQTPMPSRAAERQTPPAIGVSPMMET